MSRDYDVEALALVTPSGTTPLQPYRPAVSVRNNGVHNATSYGYFRIYDAADRLIFETNLSSSTIAPGDNGTALGADNWTPQAEGVYLIYAYVSCEYDQDEANNLLQPHYVTISGAPPGPPSPVAIHAQQHEQGGGDVISVEGLSGILADPQPPEPHAASHQAGGSDQVNVASLTGLLATPQTPANHGNEHHSPAMATSTELTSHENATVAHPYAANLAKLGSSGPEGGFVLATELADPTSESGNPNLDILTRAHLWTQRSTTPTFPAGLTCAWDGTNPLPTGWHEVMVHPALTIPYVWIQYTGIA
jgi:hypothetical protein